MPECAPWSSVTRLHLISWRGLPMFIWHSLAAVRQARRAPGFRGGWPGGESGRGNWTSTVWESAEAMMAFRNSAAHLNAMPRLPKWCDEASYTHWEQAEATPPTAEAVYQRMANEGRQAKVLKPSAAHAAGRTVQAGRPKVVQMLAAKAPARDSRPQS